MRIRVYKRGPSWWLDYRFAGRRWRYPVGDTRRVADDAVELIQAQAAAGTFTGPRSELERTDLPRTMKALCDAFVEKKESTVRPNTLRGYKQAADRAVAYFKADTVVVSISRAKVNAYAAALRSKLAPASVNQHLVFLRSLFKYARERGIVGVNLAQHVPLEKTEGRERFLTPDEAKRLQAACRPRVRDVVVALLNTGARRGDLLGDRLGKPPLMWSDVDLDNLVVTFRHTKEGRVRRVRINSALADLFKNIPSRFNRTGPVFLDYRGKPMRSEGFGDAIHRAAKRAGLPGVRPHDLRHTAASWMVQNGIALEKVARVLGHRSLRTTQRYVHLDPEHLADAVEALVGTPRAQPAPPTAASN